MPFGRCPICGAMYHLSVNLPLDEWYRQYWPQLHVGEEVPGLCPRCGIDLRPGHRVVVRTIPAELTADVDSGTEGIVTNMESGPEPLNLVELQGARVKSGKFRRSDLFY